MQSTVSFYWVSHHFHSNCWEKHNPGQCLTWPSGLATRVVEIMVVVRKDYQFRWINCHVGQNSSRYMFKSHSLLLLIQEWKPHNHNRDVVFSLKRKVICLPLQPQSFEPFPTFLDNVRYTVCLWWCYYVHRCHESSYVAKEGDCQRSYFSSSESLEVDLAWLKPEFRERCDLQVGMTSVQQVLTSWHANSS